jgi:hypothetical protein
MNDPLAIRDWYKQVKQLCTCPACLREGIAAEAGNVEFHHIDPSTKEESISKIVFNNLVFPDSCAATKVYVEFGKVIPLCKSHHKALHKAEERGELAFDLTDQFYQNQRDAFKLIVTRTIPPTLRQQIHV